MPQSNQGNNYILTVVDYFAKWLEATTLPDKSARTVSSTLYKIFLHMGFPAVVSSDQGREFVNGVLDTLQQKSKTEQSNGRNSANLELLIDKMSSICEIKGYSLMNLLIFYKLLKM
jgi:IS30 family transposase